MCPEAGRRRIYVFVSYVAANYQQALANFVRMSRSLLLTPFALLESQNVFFQLSGAVILSVVASPFGWLLSLLNTSLLADIAFAQSLIILLFVDLITGVWKHLKLHDFCFRRMYTGFITKFVISMLGMTAFNILGGVRELQDMDGLRGYIILVGKLINIFYVGGSAFNNMFVITGGKFPPVGWMERMKKFQTSLDIKDLKTKDHENSDIDSPGCDRM